MFAGGTGKRFWPASRKANPKQFQPVIHDSPLIKVKYDYLRLGYSPEDIFISTGQQYKEEVLNILPEVPSENFIFEPEMRDTGPAVAFAVSYVHRKFPNEIISTQWSDHHIKHPNIFIEALKHAEKLVKDVEKTVIIGVPARFASPHRGYIKFGDKLRALDNKGKITLCAFSRFVEKPSQEMAQEYIRSGDYAWNPAYNVFHPKMLFQKYQTFAPEIYETVQRIADSNFDENALKEFSSLEKIAFDYIFCENLNPSEAVVINVDMGWSDIGEWIALKETLEESSTDTVTNGNVIDLESQDSLIYNYDDEKLVATVNLKGMIVVNTPDVVAIFPKEDNAKLKTLLKELEKQGRDEFL